MRKRSAIDDQFQASLKWHLDQLPHGEKKKIEIDAGLASGYLSHMAAGRRAGSESVRHAVVSAFGKTYEQFLAKGALLLGLPVSKKSEAAPPSPEVAEWLGKARQIIEAGGEKADTLKTMIKIMKE